MICLVHATVSVQTLAADYVLSSQATALPFDFASRPAMLNGRKTRPKWNDTIPVLSCTYTGYQECQLVLGHPRALRTRTQCHRHAAPWQLSESSHRQQHQLLRVLLCHLCAYIPHALEASYVRGTFCHTDVNDTMERHSHFGQYLQGWGRIERPDIRCHTHACVQVRVMRHKHLPISIAW